MPFSLINQTMNKWDHANIDYVLLSSIGLFFSMCKPTDTAMQFYQMCW
jgi:hypothetical protein